MHSGMSDGALSDTPAWIKITVGLAVLGTALAAVFLGRTATVVALVLDFVALAGLLTFVGLLGKDEKEGQVRR